MPKSKKGACRQLKALILLTKSVALHKMSRHRFKLLLFPISNQPQFKNWVKSLLGPLQA